MKPSKLISKGLLTEVTIKNLRGETLNVRLEQNNYKDAPWVNFTASVNNPTIETEYREIFMVYNEGLARLFFKEYIELQKNQ